MGSFHNSGFSGRKKIIGVSIRDKEL